MHHQESVMYPGETRTMRIPFLVGGSGSVTSVSSTCGCLTPNTTEGEIDPGRPFVIDAVFSASKDYRDGEMLAALFVRAKVPVDEKIIRIDVSSRLASPLRWPPLRSAVEPLTSNALIDGTLGKIRVERGSHPVQFTDVSARFLEDSLPDLAISTIEAAGKDAWIITCKRIDPSRFGPLQGILEVRPSAREAGFDFTTSRRIKYVLPGPIRAARNAVVVGAVPLLGRRQGMVGLYRSDEAGMQPATPVMITSSDPGRLQGKLITGEQGGSAWQIAYEFVAQEPVGNASAFLTISCSNGATMRIRFYALVTGEAEIIPIPAVGNDF